ncbi:MAG TPA: M23 family metallopeptidase [Gemmatimonadaceae bacterium]
MKRPSILTVAIAVSAAVVVVALTIVLPVLPHPKASEPFAQVTPDSDSLATPPVAEQPAQAVWHEQSDTLHEGETLSALLSRSGMESGMIGRVLRAAVGLDARRARAGMPITVRTRTDDSIPSEIVFKLAVDRVLHVERTDSGWSSTEVRLPWTTDTVAVAGTITSNLYDAIDSAAPTLPSGARSELAWSLADIYEYRVDMSRDLQQGDSFRALFVRQVGPGGIVRIGNILAARFTLSGETTEAIRFATSDSHAEYYDQNGKSLRAAFLRVPLEFRRISSGFGRRFHPILKRWREHDGIDYAASMGTPVRAIGDGVVIFAGRKGGYGNAIDIRHPNGFISRYGHMRAFARGITRGKRVSIGQTIGYVGMTGLATGPHLHFEIIVNGVPRDPRLALKREVGIPLPASQRARFADARQSLLAALDDTAYSQQLAMR